MKTNRSFVRVLAHGAILFPILAACSSAPAPGPTESSQSALFLNICPGCTANGGWSQCVTTAGLPTAQHGACNDCGGAFQLPCSTDTGAQQSGCQPSFTLDGLTGICAAGAGCTRPAVATSQGCLVCGENGEPVCPENVCFFDQLNLVDHSGTCTACGANGEIACLTGCNEGSINAGGTCGPCGAAGEPACVACGQPDGPTCPLVNDGCNSGTQDVTGTCECGAIGQVYCETGGKCAACAAGACKVGTSSDGSGVVIANGECAECGEIGQGVCTVGNACVSGAESNGSGKCVAIPPPPCVPGSYGSGTFSTSPSVVESEMPFTLTVTYYSNSCQAQTGPTTVYIGQEPTNVSVDTWVYPGGFAALPGGNEYTFTDLKLPPGQYMVNFIDGKYGKEQVEGQVGPITVQ